MTVLFSILLYPVFFILMYAVGEYIFDSRNMTLAFALLSAFVISYIYFTVREKNEERNRKKSVLNTEKQTLISRTMLLDKKIFNSLFPNALCNNSTGINEDQLLNFLRKNGIKKKIDIFSLNGMTNGCRSLLDLMQIEYVEHSIDEILSVTRNLDLPEIELKKHKSRVKMLKDTVLSKPFRKFSLKYGLILIFASIFTVYKIYYIVLGSALIFFAIISRIFIKTNQQNQIPDLQS